VQRHCRTLKKKVHAFFPGILKTYGIARCMSEGPGRPHSRCADIAQPTNSGATVCRDILLASVSYVTSIYTKQKKKSSSGKFSPGSACPRDHTAFPSREFCRYAGGAFKFQKVTPIRFRPRPKVGPIPEVQGQPLGSKEIQPKLLESEVTMTRGWKNVATPESRWQRNPHNTYVVCWLARKSWKVENGSCC
jgi:hypothetical protein